MGAAWVREATTRMGLEPWPALTSALSGPRMVAVPGREAGDGTGKEKRQRRTPVRTAGRQEGVESPLWEASLDHVSPQHHRLKSHLYSLLSPSFQAARVLQCHPGTKQKRHHDENADHLKPTPSSPWWHSQAYLLSWWPVGPLRSLHPGKPDDTLQPWEASLALWRSSGRSDRRHVGRNGGNESVLTLPRATQHRASLCGRLKAHAAN